MAENVRALLIISRDALAQALEAGDPDALLRLLASLERKGHRLVLTAPEPDRWVPTRRNVDQALAEQQTLAQGVRAAGGDLDGIYYVPRSLLTQDRNRAGALQDILSRYSVGPPGAVLISASAPFLKAAQRLGIDTLPIATTDGQGNTMRGALEGLAQAD